MNRREFFGLSRAGLVAAPLLLKDLMKDPEDDSAHAELIVKDGTILENSHLDGVMIRAIGGGKVLLQNLHMKARPGQRAAVHVENTRISGQ